MWRQSLRTGHCQLASPCLSPKISTPLRFLIKFFFSRANIKVKLATVVGGDPKAPFSIATTQYIQDAIGYTYVYKISAYIGLAITTLWMGLTPHQSDTSFIS